MRIQKNNVLVFTLLNFRIKTYQQILMAFIIEVP